MTDSLHRLFDAVLASRGKDPMVSRTGRLLRAGKRKIAKKVAEEAAEVALDAVAGNRQEVIRESADLLYHLVVLWAATGVQPKDATEMIGARRFRHRREDTEGGLPDAARDKNPVPIDRARRRRAR
jgi:phosphoribosyl-ATP pyrophosphohydrolase